MRFISPAWFISIALILPINIIAQENSGKVLNSEHLRFDQCGSHWGVLDAEGNVICDYVAHIYPAQAEKTRFNNGLALVKRNYGSNEMSYMYADGQHLTDFDALAYAREFNDGYAAYRKKSNLKFGIINYKNEIILPFEYSEITSVCHKRAFVKNGQNLWALYDVENKKFMTDFTYSWVNYNFENDYNLTFGEEIVVEDKSKVKLILKVVDGQTRDYNSATTRVPNSKGYYVTTKGNYRLWESMENPAIRFKTYADSAYIPEKFIHPNLIQATFAGKVCFLDSNGRRITPLYYGIEWDNTELRPNQEAVPRYVKVYEKKKDKLTQGVFDIAARKEIVSPQYDKIYLHFSAPLMFRALKGKEHFLLDSTGRNRLSEYISFNSVPYYVNKASDVCVAAQIDPSLPSWREYYLCHLNGEKILNESFLYFAVSGSQINIHELGVPAPRWIYDMSTKQLIAGSAQSSSSVTDVVFKRTSNASVYFTDYYELQDKQGKKLLKDPVIQYSVISSSLYVLTILDKGLKTGLYDIEKKMWVNVSIDGSTVDFSPSEKVVCRFKPGVVAFGEKGSVLRIWNVFENNYRKDIEIIEFGEWGRGLLPVKLPNGKCGYMDSSFKMVIPAIYEMAYSFNYGCGGVQMVKDGRRYYGYINQSGEWLTGGEQFAECQLAGCPTVRNSDLQCYAASIQTAGLNKSIFTPLSNGHIGRNEYFDWGKYYEQQNANKVKYDPKCKVCEGAGSYIYSESCGECGGEGYIYGDVETKVIRSGGARTVYQNGGSIQMTVYDEPLVSQSRSRTKCGNCNGSGNDPESLQFKDCWKCSRRK